MLRRSIKIGVRSDFSLKKKATTNDENKGKKRKRDERHGGPELIAVIHDI